MKPRDMDSRQNAFNGLLTVLEISLSEGKKNKKEINGIFNCKNNTIFYLKIIIKNVY